MPRVTNDVLAELIENDGCRRGHVAPINATGIVRLALDLQDARARIKELECLATQISSLLSTVASTVGEAGRSVPTQSTRTPGGKRTKKKT